MVGAYISFFWFLVYILHVGNFNYLRQEGYVVARLCLSVCVSAR